MDLFPLCRLRARRPYQPQPQGARGTGPQRHRAPEAPGPKVLKASHRIQRHSSTAPKMAAEAQGLFVKMSSFEFQNY
ncbi:unnamed protein product [Merluccius merluccius]